MTSTVVRGGEVDSSTTRFERRRCGTIDSAAATTALRSARLSNRTGVGTAIRKASAGSGCAAMRRLPEASAAWTSVRSPGSSMCSSPWRRPATMRSLTSTPVTFRPELAKVLAVGRPM